MIDTFFFLMADILTKVQSEARLPPYAAGSCHERFSSTQYDILAPCDLQVIMSASPADKDTAFEEVFQSGSWKAFRRDNRLRISEESSYSSTAQGWVIDFEPGSVVRLSFPHVSEHNGEPVASWNPLLYPFDQILLIHLFHRFDAILMHSVGFVLDGVGIVSVGKSGAGKSTLANIIEPAGARVLSDDRIVVRRRDGQQYLYGTPWPGDAGHARNEGHPLSHLLFLVQSEENKLVPLSPFEAAQRLMPVCSIPWYDEGMITAYFAIIDRIVRDIPCAELHFTRSDHVLDVLNDLKA